MGASGRLCMLLRDTLSMERIDHVIETGTFNGLGSTKFVSESFPKGRPPRQFVTIETNWSSWCQAKRNLRQFSFVLPLWGKTVPLDRALQFLDTDDVLRNHHNYPDIFIDDTSDPLQFYREEAKGRLGGVSKNPRLAIHRMFDRILFYAGDNLLEKYLLKFRSANPLVILDSAGGIGFLEFSILEEVMRNHPYLICLDDVHHIKHFRSAIHIKNDPHFRLLGVDELEGWLLAKHLP